MTDAIFKNYLTSFGGILAGIPALLAGAGIVLPPTWQKVSTLCQGLGVLLLGIAAKQWNNHSTIAQVEQATVGEMPKAVEASTVHAIQPLPQGGVAVSSATTIATKPPDAPPKV